MGGGWIQRIIFHNGTLKVISFFIALCLWFIVLGSRTTQVTKEIPIEVIPPEDLVVSNDIPDRVAFVLSGPRAFLRAILDRREESIRINLQSAGPGRITYRFFSDNIRLPIGVKVVSIQPNSITPKLERIGRKVVPVKIALEGKPGDGFRVKGTKIIPSTVEIQGAPPKLAAISEIIAKPINVRDRTETFEQPVELDLSLYQVRLGTQSAVPKVRVEIVPESANYRIRNVEIRVISDRKFRLSHHHATLFVWASKADLARVDQSKVYGELDLRGKQSGDYKEAPKFIVPVPVKVMKAVPPEVAVTLF